MTLPIACSADREHAQRILLACHRCALAASRGAEG
jgi:hypothetical protein